jgi:hypothetical protein
MNLPIILIAGDVYADWLLFEKESPNSSEQKADGSNRAWKQEKQVFIPAVHGGAWIVERFLRLLLAPKYCPCVYTYRRFDHQELRAGDSKYVVHQLTSLKHFLLNYEDPKSSKVYRAIPGSYRFTGPEDNNYQIHPYLIPGNATHDIKNQCTKVFDNCSSTPEDKEIYGDVGYMKHLKKSFGSIRYFPEDTDERIIVLYDRGNGFAYHKNRYPDIRNDNKTVKQDTRFCWEYLFLKTNQPTAQSGSKQFIEGFDLVKHVILSVKEFPIPDPKNQGDALRHPILDYLIKNRMLDKTTIVLDANDLRSKGAHITRGASWERTAEDTLKLFKDGSLLASIKEAHKVVIRFGVSGAVVRIHDNGLDQTSLVFDPTCNETGYGDVPNNGIMYPMDAVVVASLASEVFSRTIELKNQRSNIVHNCLQSVSIALAHCRTYFDRGVNPHVLDRKSIEGWDADFEPRDYDETSSKLDKRATIIGTYAKENREKNKVTLKWHISINDEYDFGKFFREPNLALHVCRIVAEEIFYKRAVGVMDEIVCESKIVHRPFITQKVEAYAGRTSRIFASLSLDLANLEDHEKDSFKEALMQHLSKLTAHQIPDDINSLGLSTDDWIVVCVKYLITNIHESVSQEYHHRMYSPFAIFKYSGDCFSSEVLPSPLGDNWGFLPTSNEKLIEIARNIVVYGFERTRTHDDGAMPYAKFGKMTIVDRQEIETFRSLNFLIRNYLNREYPDRPLCAAVFGPPGSGKSFGVKQLALSCGLSEADMLEFNLSQFESRRDLERALINIRNVCSPSRTPLVFFDEFDSTHGSEPLGWLKMFLSVMQDGTFAFGGDIMRLGKSILVFAGGTSHSFAQFSGSGIGKESFDHKYFRSVKGPDFVSRLRGYVDVAGINPVDVLAGQKGFHFLRRGAMIRSIVSREYPDLVNQDGIARIDPGVLNALISVSRYTHGARSLAAIFDMSNIVGHRTFEKSYLPSAQQLAMHLESVDSHNGVDEFFSLLDPLSTFVAP